MNFRGNLLDHGRVVRDNVAGEIWPPVSGQAAGLWTGYLRLREGMWFAPGSAYRLELDDGRATDIVVIHASNRAGVAYFHSQGPPQ